MLRERHNKLVTPRYDFCCSVVQPSPSKMNSLSAFGQSYSRFVIRLCDDLCGNFSVAWRRGYLVDCAFLSIANQISSDYRRPRMLAQHYFALGRMFRAPALLHARLRAHLRPHLSLHATQTSSTSSAYAEAAAAVVRSASAARTQST